MARNDWETEDAVRTLVRAEEIRKDSKLMRKVKIRATKDKNALSSISKAKAPKRKKKKQFGAY